MTELTPRDDNRKRVSEILKRVDQLIKSHEYEQAQLETERAKDIDPKNVYISAYQERINVLIEQAQRDRAVKEARDREEEETRKKLEEERAKEEAIRQQRVAEERVRQEETQRRKKIENEVIRKKVEEELRIKKEEEDVSRRLDEARRKSFGETVPKTTRKSEGTMPKVFVIDDDEKLLQILKNTIEEEQFEVFAFSTSDDAYKTLKEETPDLIVSDINLETSTMGGFSFYEKVRELDHLQEVPFVFLSGLSDDVLVRTGKELGIDDYITKPFSDKNLLAVIKGKIKRYRELKASRKL